MVEHVELIGHDDVRSAGHTIRSAAEQMSSAAMTMDGAAHIIRDALDRHQMFMDDWLNRFETILRDHRNGRQ